MKKFLIFGLLLPLAALAQNAESGHGKAIIADQSGAQAHDIPFAKTSPIRVPMNKVNDGKVHMDIGFVTTYDLQAATSVSRRIVLHKNGVVGATCTYSQKLNSWPDRGTAFNVYRDTNFLGTSHTTKRIESQRTGYPCITSIMDGGVERDLIVSHYASQTNADTSGGLFILENDSVGSDNFTETKITVPFGPLWPRVAASGDYVHIIANYFITGRASKDTVFRNGVRQPLVYYRYRISTKTFDIKGVALPGYASDRYASGSSDAYAIDAKDSTVAVVIGGTNSDIAFWKSNDNGNNWTKTVIDSFKKAPYDIIKDVDTFSQRTRCNVQLISSLTRRTM